MMHVLEHGEDDSGFLRDAANRLAGHGMIFIEAPAPCKRIPISSHSPHGSIAHGFSPINRTAYRKV